jgi:hypothetical protein
MQTLADGIQPEIDIKGQHYDEFSLGYERALGGETKAGVRGIYRVLREVNEDGAIPGTGELWWGNPGRGELRDLPKPRREYSAVEVSWQYAPKGRTVLLASYVLSRTWGNYMGLYNSDWGHDLINSHAAFDEVSWMRNSTGLLPNDRAHVVKLAGGYPVGYGLTVGASLVWQSGTPLSEFGPVEPEGLPYGFLRKRGTAGRTPSIWDLGLRFRYDIPSSSTSHGGWPQSRLILDLVHVGSPRKVVDRDQTSYFTMDSAGDLIDPNPNYGRATKYQSPMAMRIGMEVAF